MKHRIGRKGLDHGSLWPRFLVAATGTLLAFFLAEGILGLILPPPIVWRTPQERYENHPTRLFALRPDQRAFTHDKPVRINALGLRGGEVTIPKPEKSYRIVVMGDSVTFGNGVGDGETYSAQLARTLHESGLRRVEVINAGIPAYDTWQHALLLEELVISLEPNIVILGFYQNDISPRPNVLRPVIGQNGEPPRRGLGAWLGDRRIALLKKSRVLVLAREAYLRARAKWSPSPAAARRMALLKGGQHPALQAGWREVSGSLDRMRALLDGAGIPFRIVIFPMPEQVWNTEANTSAYQGYFQDIAREIGVPTLDLLPAFRTAISPGKSLYISWDWHPNPEGHQLAAQAIASYVRPLVTEWMVKNTIPVPGPSPPIRSALPASVR